MSAQFDARKLDIGAGNAEHVAGAIRLDRARGTRTHVVADLDKGALPFRSGVFEEVGAFDVVEHVADMVALVEEVHRVLKPAGRFLITTPHFSSANAHTDPTHRRALGLRSFDYFAATHELSYYSSARFHVRVARLFFKGKLVGRLAFHIARLWPAWYEDHLAWILPGWMLYFELEAAK
ncbi:MAG: methyltransferase domain-containing protein [Gemmatimonadales bacterium]